jgi:LPXTG-motif cell wall-anchored protein
MVDIYRNTYSEDGLTLEKSGELYKTVELSEATYWTMTLTLPLAEFDSDGAIHTYQYFVKEQEGSLPYIVSYTDTDGETLQLEEMTPGSGEALPSVWLKASKESYSASAEVIITNTLGFELPQTGGTKHTLYTLSGLAIILVTSSVYIITRRRKHIRGNGG